MNVLSFSGGLGNQMFQFAFYLFQRKKQYGCWFFDVPTELKYHHQGFELDKVFNLCKYYRFHRSILKLLRRIGIKQVIVTEKSGIYYNEIPMSHNIRGNVTLYHGFWQSEKYFIEVEEEVREKFEFHKSLLNEKSRCLLELLTNSKRNFVSIHIRRGDYMEDLERQVCTSNYYYDAISYIKKHVVQPNFVVFSDDILWCKEHLIDLCDRVQYVDWNTGRDSWQDMCLMSNCSHHIIANSSFSWWGAWLNKNSRKIVVSPKRWNVDFPLDSDRIPQNWIKL